MKFELKKFNDLTIDDLYILTKTRQSIFIVEQNCPYNDLDEKDQVSLHLLGYKDKSEKEKKEMRKKEDFYLSLQT